MHTSMRYASLLKKQKILILKILIDKIQKLIVKEIKLNINRHIATKKNKKITTFLKSNNA
jgi:hypothetical protein